MSEGAVLGLIAGICGLLFCAVGIRNLVALDPPNLPRLNETSIDFRVLVFATGVSLLAGFLCGLAPAWMVWRGWSNETLKEGGRTLTTGERARRTRNSLVVAEFALAVVLLTGAGLLIRSFVRVLKVDPGFRSEQVLVMRIDFSQAKTEAQVGALYQQVLERVAALPGVKAAGAISEFFIQNNPNATVTVEGQGIPSVGPMVRHAISRYFFQALGVELLRGRSFTDEDFREAKQEGYRVAIINETMARRLWPAADPIGKRFKDGGPDSTDPWLTVVGVVKDMRRQGLEKQPILQAFVPHMSWSSRNQHLLVRAASDPVALAPIVRDAVRSVDKTLPVFGVTTAERWLSESMELRRLQALLLSVFSGAALVLAMVGIYGLMNYSVAQRTHEIGVRLALGAQTRDVLRMVVREGISLALMGIAVGLVGASWLTKTMSSLLFGVSATDPLTFACVTLILIAPGSLACYLPARRAAKVDPIEALRHE